MVIGRIPRRGEDQVFHGDQLKLSILRLVDERFRPRGIQHTVGDERAVHVMNAHRPFLRTADAPARECVPGCDRGARIPQRRRRLTHGLGQRPIGVLRSFVLCSRVDTWGLLSPDDLGRGETDQPGDCVFHQCPASHAHDTSFWCVRRSNRRTSPSGRCKSRTHATAGFSPAAQLETG
jgi:hypothetical protein